MRQVLSFAFILIVALSLTEAASARGGFSSGGRGSFSSGRSFSASRSYSSPARSYSSRSYSAPRTVTTTTVTRRPSYGGGYYRGGYGGYVHPYYHPMMYPGFGMGGYGYSNGIMTGLILGNLMHPQGTVVYQGGGYNGNALLYPNGMVVDQNGYQVGTYQNNQFTAVQGGMVAQPAPQLDQPAPAATPVVVAQPAAPRWSAAEIICAVLAVVLLFAWLIF